MFFSGMWCCAFHFSALAGVPVMMPARRQYFVFCNAGAIWFVLRLPRPHKAKLSFPAGSAARAVDVAMPEIVAPAATPAMPSEASRKNWRREHSPVGGSLFSEFMMIVRDCPRMDACFSASRKSALIHGLTFYIVGE